MGTHTARPPGPIVLAFPPELDYLGGLFLPDPVRARLLGRAFLLCRNLGGEGGGLLLDPGGEGVPARERARWLPAGRVLVLGAPRDEAAARILAGALEEAGATVEGPWIGGSLPEERILSLCEGTGSRPQQSTPLLAPPPFMIFHSREAKALSPPEGPIFLRKGPNLLERIGPGGWGFLSPSVERIQILGEDEPVPPGRKDTLLVLPVPPPSSPPARRRNFLERVARAAGRFGESNLALLPPRGFRSGESLPAGAPWAAFYGLDDPRTARLLLEACAAAFPARSGVLHAALGFHACRIDPLEEIYAGRHLADRNQDLIVNIVP